MNREEIMGAIQTGPEHPSGAGTTPPNPTATLLGELAPNTDLASLVERVVRDSVPWVVIPAAALTAWGQRDPAGWAKVSAWLAVNGVTIVRI
jgi:hypothetical protein